MAYSSIVKPTDYFNTKLYTGNGSTNAITGVGFQPDWTWIKYRNSATYGHDLYDAVRGATKTINTNNTSAEYTSADRLTAFNSDGFTLGSGAPTNDNSGNFVSWNWKANGQGSSNTDGTINSTYTSANTTSGFSIVTYTGTGSAGTVGHGLGTTPSMVWIFNRTDSGNPHVFHKALGSTQYLLHASTLGVQTYAPVGIGTLTSTTFSVGTVNGVNGSGKNYVAYVFAEKKGYSKIESFSGNSSTDGSFVFCGFRPAMVICKASSTTGDWKIFDSKRIGYNAANYRLQPNSSAAETSDSLIDFLSNGFKMRTSSDSINTASTVIFMAFAEEPLVANVGASIPATAR